MQLSTCTSLPTFFRRTTNLQSSLVRSSLNMSFRTLIDLRVIFDTKSSLWSKWRPYSLAAWSGLVAWVREEGERVRKMGC